MALLCPLQPNANSTASSSLLTVKEIILFCKSLFYFFYKAAAMTITTEIKPLSVPKIRLSNGVELPWI
jgi:hypothetical protein